jgi:hypothetical protein
MLDGTLHCDPGRSPFCALSLLKIFNSDLVMAWFLLKEERPEVGLGHIGNVLRNYKSQEGQFPNTAHAGAVNIHERHSSR